MIIFQTEHMELYNHIVHTFLDINLFGDPDIDKDDIIEDYYPKYLFREQYFKCIKTFEELYEWTEDAYYHEMSAFHELALYNFVNAMADLKDEMPEFDEIYFDEKAKQMIKEAAQIDYDNQGDEKEFSVDEFEEEFYDVSNYPDLFFTDTDFEIIDILYSHRQLGLTDLEQSLGISMDFYYELLPMDIQKKHNSKHVTLSGEVSEFLDFVEQRINNGNLFKLFWADNVPVNEDRIHLILENIMSAYFYSKNVDISREAIVGTGKVDFKLFKTIEEDEKVLIEVKLAKSTRLQSGYEKQLIDYMRSSGYTNAFYVIACFTDEEYEKTLKFIRENIYTDTYRMYINISTLDLRKRKTPSVK